MRVAMICLGSILTWAKLHGTHERWQPMRTITAIPATAIALTSLMLFTSSVDARRGGGGHSIGRSASRMSHPVPSAPRSIAHSSQRARNASTSNKVHHQDQRKRTAAGKAAKSGNRNANAARMEVQQRRLGAEHKS